MNSVCQSGNSMLLVYFANGKHTGHELGTGQSPKTLVPLDLRTKDKQQASLIQNIGA